MVIAKLLRYRVNGTRSVDDERTVKWDLIRVVLIYVCRQNGLLLKRIYDGTLVLVGSFGAGRMFTTLVQIELAV